MDLPSGAARADRGRVAQPRRIVSNLRWWIGALLFASTVINYIDRQTLSVLAPYLKAEYHWTNSDFALIVIAFRLSYAIVQFVGGRVVDVLGTRLGLSLAVDVVDDSGGEQQSANPPAQVGNDAAGLCEAAAIRARSAARQVH